MKSAVSFFRKQLGYKGRSQHNGRGVYEMDIDHEEDYAFNGTVEDRIRFCLEKWQTKGLVEKVEETDQSIKITLKDELFDRPDYLNDPALKGLDNQSYRTLYYGKKFQTLGVVMTF
jgi:hypothetical protein